MTAMLQQPVDWRHWLAAAMVVALLAIVGWKIVNRPTPRPATAAPAGAYPRMQDAPE